MTIETPRYRKFTRILQQIASRGGQVIEIAGNDDIMVSVVAPQEAGAISLKHGTRISRITRDAYGDDRILIGAKVAKLTPLLQELRDSGVTLEHIYDY